jgi:N-methylhydantoinase B
MTSTAHAIDPITLEVLWNRLLSVVNEQQVALMRTAFSTVVRETQDLACGVFDGRGRMIAQSLTGTPGHINAMATGVQHFLRVFPPESLAPGDVLITNDPWMTSGQINDMTVVSPVFKKGKVVAYFASTCHAPDIGGRLFSGEAREVFEEGLRVPIMKLFIAGEPNEPLMQIIRANVRTPDETIGDLYAQMSSNAVGAHSLLAFLDEFGMDDVEPLADAIIERSERAMRDSIRQLPNGVYTNESWSDGFDEPILIRCTVTVRDEDIDIDFDGSSPQSKWGINVVLNYTHAYSSFAIKTTVSPDVPHNHGAFLPVHVTAPEGSILNCQEPAAVASRHIIGHFLPGVILGALEQVMPERIIAGSADPIWISVWHGRERPGAEPFTFSLFQCGGMGARAGKDGLSATGFPSGVAGVPAEVVESLAPLVQRQRELKTDSGGPGLRRGGLGQHSEMTARYHGPLAVSALVDRIDHPAEGVAGGGRGAAGVYLIDDTTRPQAKAQIPLQPGARVRLDPPGGGGFGDPFQRDPDLVLRDVLYGYVSPEGAARDYGVAVEYTGRPDALVRMPGDYRIDRAATERLRAGR